MLPPSYRPLRVAGIVVAVLLLGLAVYPGTLTSPYVSGDDTPRYAHTIVPESSAEYEEVTSEHDPEVYQYGGLSPTAQELFDRTRAAEPRPDGERRYIPTVCREFVLVCDEYAQDELPEEFTYGTELSYDEAFVIIEDGDNRYLLRTGITGHLLFAPFPVGFALAVLTMLPLAVFVATVTFRSKSKRLLGGTVGGGALVATLGVVAPYIEMAGLLPTWVLGVVLLGGVWFAILAAGGYRLYWMLADRDQHSTLDGQ